jgi:predicted nucleotidyltransferase
MDKSEAIESIKVFAEKIRDAFDPLMIVLYGSYAKGTFTETSDIDVAVIVNSIEGDFLEQEAELYRMRREVVDRIEPLLIEFGNDKSGFLKHILNSGEILYERNAERSQPNR